MPNDRAKTEPVDHAYYAKFAQEARDMAGRTSLARSKDLYLMLAAEYDAKAAAVARTAPGARD